MKRIILIGLGCVSLAIGAIGAFIPLLPSFPFLLFAGFCFAKSSQRLNNWFLQTKLYKNNLESYVSGRGMSQRAKIKITVTVTLFMVFALYMMRNAPIYAKIILGVVWLGHILYFAFGIKKAE